MTRRLIGWLVATALGLGSATAAAQPDDGLAWTAVDRCGSLIALRARIAQHLGRPLVVTDAIHADVEVIRTPIEGDVRATVTIATRRGRTAREVHGADCAAVVDAVAFVLASAVSEEAVAPPLPRPDPIDAVEEPTPRVRAPARGSSPWPVERARASIVAGLDSWSDEGTLPARQFGVGGSLALSRGAYRGELGVVFWGGDVLGRARGGVSMRSYSFRGCRGIRRLWLCAGLLQGTIRSAPRFGGSPDRAWTALAFQTLWTRSLVGPVRIAASIEGVTNLVRPGFYVAGGRIEDRPELFALRLGLGLGIELW